MSVLAWAKIFSSISSKVSASAAAMLMECLASCPSVELRAEAMTASLMQRASCL